MKQNVGTRIRKLRKEHRHTLKDLEKNIDFNYSNLSKIERGMRSPTYDLLEKLSKEYRVPVTYFFTGEEEGERHSLSTNEREWLSFMRECKQKGYTLETLRKITAFMDDVRGGSS